MIGLFDSGFGGLTVLRELVKIFPDYDYCFFGDNLHAPYGGRSPEAVTEFTAKGVEFLFNQGAQIVLLACNTASSDALRFLQEKYGQEKKVLGALIPALEKALTQTRFGNIGLVGTKGTVQAGNYEKELEKRWASLYLPSEKRALKKPVLISQACPLLVPLIEEGWAKKPETRMILKKYLMPLKHANIDTLILGCTHYPILAKEFAKKVPKHVQIISSSEAQAEKFADYLERHPEIEQQITRHGQREFFTSDCPDKFARLGSTFLGQKISLKKVTRIEI